MVTDLFDFMPDNLDRSKLVLSGKKTFYKHTPIPNLYKLSAAVPMQSLW